MKDLIWFWNILFVSLGACKSELLMLTCFWKKSILDFTAFCHRARQRGIACKERAILPPKVLKHLSHVEVILLAKREEYNADGKFLISCIFEIWPCRLMVLNESTSSLHFSGAAEACYHRLEVSRDEPLLPWKWSENNV